MQGLREKLYKTPDFVVGVELVSIRGSMAEKSALKARAFANELVDCLKSTGFRLRHAAPSSLAAHALGNPFCMLAGYWYDLQIQSLGKRRRILNSEGFNNILP
jgi:methylenetetrahydrofolate reductase (NADPH)